MPEAIDPLSSPEIPSGWEELTIPLSDLKRDALRWTFYFAVGLFVPYLILWGWPSFQLSGRGFAPLWLVLLYSVAFILVYAISALAHEALHALAIVVFARVPLREITFRARLREGILYVHTARPMTVTAYRLVLALPGIVQGVLPALAGLMAGSGWLVFYGFVMLSSAIGDIAMLRLMRPRRRDTLVVDHPSKLGCLISRPADRRNTAFL